MTDVCPCGGSLSQAQDTRPLEKHVLKRDCLCVAWGGNGEDEGGSGGGGGGRGGGDREG